MFMDRALWLLLWLRFRSWFRRLGRNAGSVRGALLLAAGAVFFCCIFLNPIIAYFVGPAARPAGGATLEQVRQRGPLGLFAYCALTLLFSSGERAIAFTPAEVDFLFAGPFHRRQLLAYKIAASVLGCLVTALFMTVVSLSWGAWPPAAYAGLTLTFLFLFLFGMAVGLAGNVLGARAHTWRRRLVLFGLLLLVLVPVLFLGRDLPGLTAGQVLDRVEQSAVVQAVLMPLGWFAQTIAAENFRDLLAYGARALGLDAALVVLVFALDADYLEASAAASERTYARLQRVRQAGASAGWYRPGPGKRVTLPSLPWWGGVGPVAWRQLLAALRSLRGLTIFLAILGGALLVVPVIALVGREHPAEPALGWLLASALGVLSLLSLPATLTFDFRGDVDRMDVLKALPIAPWRVVVGQLAGVVLLLGAIELLGLAGIQALFGGVLPVLLAALVLCWPANFLTVGIDNLLFLWFPTRQVLVQPGDFQMMGRQMVLMLAKFLTLGIAFGTAAVIAGLVALLTGGSLPAVVLAAFVVLMAWAAGLVPVLALAFANFDVARDTPP
jgi:hypothetical protein